MLPYLYTGVLTRFMARIYAQRGAIDSCRELMNGLMESKIYNYQTGLLVQPGIYFREGSLFESTIILLLLKFCFKSSVILFDKVRNDCKQV